MGIFNTYHQRWVERQDDASYRDLLTLHDIDLYLIDKHLKQRGVR